MGKYSDLSDKTVFDFASEKELDRMCIPNDKVFYLKMMTEKTRIINLYEYASGVNNIELEEQLRKQYPIIVEEYERFFDE